mgnify:CR=1 FL=1|jgi:hypothetical protein
MKSTERSNKSITESGDARLDWPLDKSEWPEIS